jgi:hypothetical protein
VVVGAVVVVLTMSRNCHPSDDDDEQQQQHSINNGEPKFPHCYSTLCAKAKSQRRNADGKLSEIACRYNIINIIIAFRWLRELGIIKLSLGNFWRI